MNSGYRSIGEVLSLLAAEHPDLTISKIRFLESQGLVTPRRTPSGYRKFFDADIEQLDWVLTQQRDHFLPLKEIKRRLASGVVTSRAARAASSLTRPDSPIPSLFARHDAEDTSGEPAAPAESGTDAPPVLEGSVSLSAGELANAVGTDLEFIVELQRLGIIAPMAPQDSHAEPAFDHEALLTARNAAAFEARGLTTRSLRMFRVAADREAGVYEQLMASVRARGDTARLRTELTEIVDLADSLRRQILRRLLRPYLD